MVDPHHLSGVDPKKQSMRLRVATKLGQRQMKRIVDGSLRACISIFPTNAYASAAEMSLEDFEDFVFSACYVDYPDPLKRWKEVTAYQNKLIRHLEMINTDEGARRLGEFAIGTLCTWLLRKE